MKKTYQLNIEGKNRDRLLEAAKHDIRKYLKRERAKALPAGADFWDFDTRSGTSEATAESVLLADLMASIDALLSEGGGQFYVEVMARAAQRPPRPVGTALPQGDADDGFDD